MEASENFKNERKDHYEHEEFKENDHDEALDYVLSFLWCCHKNLIDPPTLGITSDDVINTWSAKIHSEMTLLRPAIMHQTIIRTKPQKKSKTPPIKNELTKKSKTPPIKNELTKKSRAVVKHKLPTAKNRNKNLPKSPPPPPSKKFTPNATYKINELIFAWDRNALYESKVVKTKLDDENKSKDNSDDKDNGNSNNDKKYLVHYVGYKKSHDKWLSEYEMMKHDSNGRAYFKDERGKLPNFERNFERKKRGK